MGNSSICEEYMTSMSRFYPTGDMMHILTSQEPNVYHRQPKGLKNLKENRISLGDPFPCGLSGSEKILSRINIQSTSEVEIMKVDAQMRSVADDQCEYDIAIPSPPPNRRYKVKLNIRSIKKGKPTVVYSDWI
jgi:hypothetical protein